MTESEVELAERLEFVFVDERPTVQMFRGEVLLEDWCIDSTIPPSPAFVILLVYEAFIGVENKLKSRDELLTQAAEWIQRGSLKGVGWNARREWLERVEGTVVVEPVFEESETVGSDAPPAMPDWATPEGPWCLKQWLPMGFVDPKVDLCLLLRGHERDCRTLHYGWRNRTNALFMGQLQNREDDAG